MKRILSGLLMLGTLAFGATEQTVLRAGLMETNSSGAFIASADPQVASLQKTSNTSGPTSLTLNTTRFTIKSNKTDDCGAIHMVGESAATGGCNPQAKQTLEVIDHSDNWCEDKIYMWQVNWTEGTSATRTFLANPNTPTDFARCTTYVNSTTCGTDGSPTTCSLSTVDGQTTPISPITSTGTNECLARKALGLSGCNYGFDHFRITAEDAQCKASSRLSSAK